jgi:alkanesulfonate monooxygenase SsuD/methylene tetrahydromethanopterin reductase-like flavin-dependent oxidoreductase (luciferase family)
MELDAGLDVDLPLADMAAIARRAETQGIAGYLAAVGPGMVRLAGEVADGLVVHPLHSRAYLEDVILPTIAASATDAGRDASAITISASAIVATTDDVAPYPPFGTGPWKALAP